MPWGCLSSTSSRTGRPPWSLAHPAVRQAAHVKPPDHRRLPKCGRGGHELERRPRGIEPVARPIEQRTSRRPAGRLPPRRASARDSSPARGCRRYAGREPPRRASGRRAMRVGEDRGDVCSRASSVRRRSRVESGPRARPNDRARTGAAGAGAPRDSHAERNRATGLPSRVRRTRYSTRSNSARPARPRAGERRGRRADSTVQGALDTHRSSETPTRCTRCAPASMTPRSSVASGRPLRRSTRAARKLANDVELPRVVRHTGGTPSA